MTEVELMINDCMKRESKLNAWELNFIQSMEEDAPNGNLTSMQVAKLEEIWERIT